MARKKKNKHRSRKDARLAIKSLGGQPGEYSTYLHEDGTWRIGHSYSVRSSMWDRIKGK